MTHTPGPWIVRNCSDAMAEKFTVERITDGLRSVICRLNDVEVCPEHGGTGSDANAAYIVRACNAHEELYALAARIEDALRRLPELPPTISLLDMEQLRNAIAKAEGRG